MEFTVYCFQAFALVSSALSNSTVWQSWPLDIILVFCPMIADSSFLASVLFFLTRLNIHCDEALEWGMTATPFIILTRILYLGCPSPSRILPILAHAWSTGSSGMSIWGSISWNKGKRHSKLKMKRIMRL